VPAASAFPSTSLNAVDNDGFRNISIPRFPLIAMTFLLFCLDSGKPG
jgi:hypothetical protein